MLVVKLWGINRWLRYTGIRAVVVAGGDAPTQIGFMWGGLPGSKRWRQLEEISVTEVE